MRPAGTKSSFCLGRMQGDRYAAKMGSVGSHRVPGGGLVVSSCFNGLLISRRGSLFQADEQNCQDWEQGADEERWEMASEGVSWT